MADHRAYPQVVQSHLDTWIRPLTTQDLDTYGGNVAVVLGHAACLAEAVAAGLLEREDGERQVLAALSAAELLDGTACGR